MVPWIAEFLSVHKISGSNVTNWYLGEKNQSEEHGSGQGT